MKEHALVDWLLAWQIPYITENPSTKPKVNDFIKDWLDSKPLTSLVLCEADTDDTVSSHETACWILSSLMKKNKIKTFIQRLSGLQIFDRSFDVDASGQNKWSRVNASSVVWIEEIAAAQLTDFEVKQFFAFLNQLRTLKTPVIMSVSVTPETLSKWVGPVISKELHRHYTFIEV